MRFKYLTISLLAVVMLLTSNVTAKDLSLNDCIDLALQNRSSIIAARGREDVAKAGKLSALGAFLPRVDASYNYSKGKETNIKTFGATEYDSTIITRYAYGDSAKSFVKYPLNFVEIDAGDQDFGPNKSLTLSANMWLLNIGNFYSLSAAKANAEVAHLDVLNSEQDLIYAVKVSYFAYLASVENVDVQEEAVKRSEEQLKLIQSRYDLGSASLSDVLKQKVQSGNDQLSLLTATNTVVTAEASLAYTIGLDPNKNHTFSKEYSEHTYTGSIDDAISFGLSHEPGLLSAQSGLFASQKGVKQSLAGYLPTVSANASYTKFTGTQAFPTVFDYSSDNLRYGFSINWNLFDGFQTKRSVTTAKINRNNARAQVAETKNFLAREIKTAFFDIEQQKKSKNIAQANVDASTEDLKITQEKYNLGAATILDILNAQVSLKTAQVSYIRADFDLNLAVAKLENAMGKM